MKIDDYGYLASLQFSDSAFPIGRFAHSYGLESFLYDNPDVREAEIGELITSLILQSVAPLDAVAVLHSYTAAKDNNYHSVLWLDRLVTSKKLSEGSRRASSSCGRNQAAIGVMLSSSELLRNLHSSIQKGQTDGNAAIVTGVMAYEFQIEARAAALMELRGVVTATLSACVRLGRLSALRAQAMLSESKHIIIKGLAIAESLRPDEMWSTTPELDIYLLKHNRLDMRQFLT